MNKTIIFYDPAFPLDGARPNRDFFDQLDNDMLISDATSLAKDLASGTAGVLINLHGPYFPKYAWPAIRGHLHTGGGLVHIGGAPFCVPCYQENGAWKKERAQTAYHQEMNIHETLPVRKKPVVTLAHLADIPLFEGKAHLFTVEDTYNFILHVSKASAIEEEMGSAGPMDAHIYPLLKGISANGREVAAPSVLIENTKGTFAGGRWVFVNQPVTDAFWSVEGAAFLEELCAFVACGVTDMWLKTNYASFATGERATIMFQLEALKGAGTNWTLTFDIHKNGERRYTTTKRVEATGRLQSEQFVFPEDVTPGYYEVTCRAESDRGEYRVLHQGFWGFDEALLTSGSKLTYGRDYFEKDGRPFPIVGMTYMTSDVARYYLFLPNPSRWDADMRQMKHAGINYIRTGIWTAWRHMMFADGHMDESVLRAIDAFILCAKKHDLHVTFNFFSFTPEAWEGENPYLDPRNIEAQKRFITSVVSRHANTTHIDWDLINEPTMFDPERIFDGPRPVHDAYEREAYQAWLEQRHGFIRALQERWHMTEAELPAFTAVEPPEPSEINFSYRDMITGKKGLKWLDYTLFTMEMHNKWARDMTETIKEVAPGHLVTVGQDEALGAQRPSPFFYNEAVDYTSNHTWWLLDDLVWDGIFTKAPYKPNLIQETGIMYVEQPDGQARRSEEELRNILERKYAYAFSTGATGAVQWLWNTNFYMNNINESNIGAIRADGTEKPETNVSYDFGSFIGEIRDLFQGRQLEEVGVVFPYSNDFSNRKLALDATTNLTRVLAYEMNVPFRGLGEYQLDIAAEDMPKLLVVPSAHNVSNDAMEQILEAVREQGVTVLFTGPINLDAYWHETPRMDDMTGRSTTQNVRREEILRVDGDALPVSFGGDQIGYTLKGAPEEFANDGTSDSSRTASDIGTADRAANTENMETTVENGQSGTPGHTENTTVYAHTAEHAGGGAPDIETAGHMRTDSIIETPLGSGRIIWSPLPVELNDRNEPMIALYRYALKKAGVATHLNWLQGDLPGVYGRKLDFAYGSLFVFVSEFGQDTLVSINDPASDTTYTFELEAERTVMFATDQEGRVTNVYRPGEVAITVE